MTNIKQINNPFRVRDLVHRYVMRDMTNEKETDYLIHEALSLNPSERKDLDLYTQKYMNIGAC